MEGFQQKEAMWTQTLRGENKNGFKASYGEYFLMAQ